MRWNVGKYNVITRVRSGPLDDSVIDRFGVASIVEKYG
jgi:hypothetical protein